MGMVKGCSSLQAREKKQPKGKSVGMTVGMTETSSEWARPATLMMTLGRKKRAKRAKRNARKRGMRRLRLAAVVVVTQLCMLRSVETAGRGGGRGRVREGEAGRARW